MGMSTRAGNDACLAPEQTFPSAGKAFAKREVFAWFPGDGQTLDSPRLLWTFTPFQP